MSLFGGLLWVLSMLQVFLFWLFPPPFPRGNVEVYKSIHQQKYQLEVRTLKVNYKPVKNAVNLNGD